MSDAVAILLEGGRVQLSAHGAAFWTTEGEALMLAHALIERLAPPSIVGKTVKPGVVVSVPSPASKPFAAGRVVGGSANKISVFNPRLTWPRGYGPSDGNAEWDTKDPQRGLEEK